MAKTRALWNENVYKKRLKEGRGQGELESYRPWLTIHDLPSKGYATRIYGQKTNRIHHLLSHHELYYFCLLDYSEHVVDIREQFPMRLTETLEIANHTGIPHPWDNRSRFPYVMTTDFLITTDHGLEARTVKTTEELQHRRVREKFEIERRYWHSCGIPWKIITEKQINVEKAKNILWLKTGIPLQAGIPDQETRERSEEFFLGLYNKPEIPFHKILESVEELSGLQPGMGLSVFKNLVISGRIALDLSAPLNLADPRKER